jgi:outer membrane protein assembly factor BamE (lipoprotein component of BamABCDE complex)
MNARIADEESLKNLIQGKTTKGEVRERFGIPQEVILTPGVETFIYYRDQSTGWLSRTTERVETLTVRFDTRGVLKDFEYRYSGK